MRYSLLVCYLFLIVAALAQSQSKSYNSSINGLFSHGNQQSSKMYSDIAINQWTEGKLQSSKNYVNQSIVRVKEINPTSGFEENFSNNNVLIYPNPFSTFINIESQIYQLTQVTILGTDGRLILRNTNWAYKRNIDLSHLQNGLYYVRIKTEKDTYTKKLIKYD